MFMIVLIIHSNLSRLPLPLEALPAAGLPPPETGLPSFLLGAAELFQ